MMITYTLTEEDIKLAIKDYCAKWLRNDQAIELNRICLRSEIDDRSQTQIFSAIATPTKIYKDSSNYI